MIEGDTYKTYVYKSLCSYFFQNIDKNDLFCKQVVTLYISKSSEHTDNIEEQVEKWFDLHNSAQFKKNIAEDCFSIAHYEEGIESMIANYVNYKMSSEYL